jgi:hypothetical protein
MSGLKVGLVWAAVPSMPTITPLARSPALEPFCDLPGVSFASLRVEPHAADVAQHPALKVIDLAAQLADFAETAGAVEALDLVITVDTAVAHLAGALGKPTWVLLPEVNDWRWMLEREDNPWYPTMRLFRQRPGDGWDKVIPRVAAELAAAASDSARLTPFREAGERRWPSPLRSSRLRRRAAAPRRRRTSRPSRR